MDELIKALETIKAECEKREYCRDCSLGNEHNECMIEANYPRGWNIIKPKKVIRLMQ